jgi:sugar lactone lactonase YvrE
MSWTQLACVTGSGFALIEQGSDSKPKLTYLAQPLSETVSRYSRLNDGACDGKGRFLAATLESKHEGNEFGGILYQYDPSDGSCKILDDHDITDGNGLGWSEDHRTLYVRQNALLTF